MITTEILRFIDKNVHRSAYIECFGQFGWEQAFAIFDINLAVNYGTTGNKTPKICWQPCTADRDATRN